jgi:hypothetical protein
VVWTIFLYSYWPLAYLIWGNIFLSLFSIFNQVILVVKVLELSIFDINLLSEILFSNIFSHLFPIYYIVMFFIIHLFTCVYTVWVTSAPCPHPLLLSPLASRQNLFCTFFQLCWRAEINKLVEIRTAIQRDS